MKSNTRNQLYISPLSNISLMSGKGKIDNGGTRRNDLIIVEGFPALNSFPPQTDDDLSEKSSNDTKKSSVATVSPDPLPLDSFLSHQSALTFPPCSGRTEQSQGLRDLLFDCEKAFAARSKDHDAAYSAGITYFLPCLMAPRCGLEALARRIFQSHVSGAGLEEGKDYDPERSGAEWWTLVLDSSAGGIQETADGVGEDDDREDDDNGEDDEVALHFDADYGLEDQLPNYLLHPRVATVTYLSDVGAPTLVLNRRSPPPDDVEKKSLGGDINCGWLSHPRVGKHIAFDGRLLHGAPGWFLPSAVSKIEISACEPATKRIKLGEGCSDKAGRRENENDRKRITFMVNIWLNHCPLDAELIEEEDMVGMRSPCPIDGKDEKGEAHFNFSFSNRPPLNSDVVKLIAGGKGAEPVGEEETVLCGRLVSLKVSATEESCQIVSEKVSECEDGSALVEFQNGAVTLEVGDVAPTDTTDDEEEGQEKT